MKTGGAGFDRTLRLLTPAEFKQVFQRSERCSDRYFTILYRPNALAHPRLGMAIAKKNLKRAVDRNLVKRLVREEFRLNRSGLSGFDLVVMCKRGLPTSNKTLLKSSLERLIGKLVATQPERITDQS
ncbi:MAG: ribonuclease P protein component [Sedimenticola sp.]